MAQIGSKDTKPEKIVRSLLHRMGYRFRLHVSELPGTPDIVLPKYQTVIMVHGCFWHRHPGCDYAYEPKSRQEYWQNKFRENIARDARTKAELEEQGWRVIVVWECETGDLSALAERLDVLLSEDES